MLCLSIRCRTYWCFSTAPCDLLVLMFQLSLKLKSINNKTRWVERIDCARKCTKEIEFDLYDPIQNWDWRSIRLIVSKWLNEKECVFSVHAITTHARLLHGRRSPQHDKFLSANRAGIEDEWGEGCSGLTSVEYMGLWGDTIHQNGTEHWNKAQWTPVL